MIRFSYIVACSTCGRTTKMVYAAEIDACVRLQVPRGWDASGGEVACARCLRKSDLEAAMEETEEA